MKNIYILAGACIIASLLYIKSKPREQKIDDGKTLVTNIDQIIDQPTKYTGTVAAINYFGKRVFFVSAFALIAYKSAKYGLSPYEIEQNMRNHLDSALEKTNDPVEKENLRDKFREASNKVSTYFSKGYAGIYNFFVDGKQRVYTKTITKKGSQELIENLDKDLSDEIVEQENIIDTEENYDFASDLIELHPNDWFEFKKKRANYYEDNRQTVLAFGEHMKKNK